jgi:CheY-like chemotaxis protein
MSTKITIPESLWHTKRVLVVEDNVLNQKLTGFMLKGWGYQYGIAANGKLAVEALRQQTYDLLLMDLEMPELNGYDAAKLIRSELKLQMPIIATSSHASEEEMAKCLRAGMDDYITKPIKGPELQEKIFAFLFPEIAGAKS